MLKYIMVQIRKATLADVSVLQDLNQKLFDHDCAYDDLLVKNWPYTEDAIKYFKKSTFDEKYCSLVAVDNDTVVGYLIGYVWNHWTSRPVLIAEVDNMLVIDEYRGKGIGSKLMTGFFEWCQQKEVKSIFVMAYTPNTDALDFYKKNGFTDLSVRLEKRF